MNRSEAKAAFRWLNGNPPLQELMDRYPGEWEEAGRRLVAALENSSALTTDEAATKARSDLETWTRRIEKSGQNPQVIVNALPHLIKSRMLLQGLEKVLPGCRQRKSLGEDPVQPDQRIDHPAASFSERPGAQTGFPGLVQVLVAVHLPEALPDAAGAVPGHLLLLLDCLD